MSYAVIDDYGDDWLNGTIAYSADTLAEVEDWAENENYHSASIVMIDELGFRTKVN